MAYKVSILSMAQGCVFNTGFLSSGLGASMFTFLGRSVCRSVGLSVCRKKEKAVKIGDFKHNQERKDDDDEEEDKDEKEEKDEEEKEE